MNIIFFFNFIVVYLFSKNFEEIREDVKVVQEIETERDSRII